MAADLDEGFAWREVNEASEPSLRGICVLSALVSPSFPPASAASLAQPDRHHGNGSGNQTVDKMADDGSLKSRPKLSAALSPVRSQLPRRGLLSPPRGHVRGADQSHESEETASLRNITLDTTPSRSSSRYGSRGLNRTPLSTASPLREGYSSSFDWHLAGLRVIRGHWAVTLERAYEVIESPIRTHRKSGGVQAKDDSDSASLNGSSSESSSIGVDAKFPAEDHSAKAASEMSQSSGSYARATFSTPVRRQRGTSVFKRQQMLCVLDAVPSAQLLNADERTWVIKLLRGELNAQAFEKGRRRPPMLFSCHDCALSMVQFSCEAYGGQQTRSSSGKSSMPLRLFAIEPSGSVFVWLWRADRWKWLFVNQFSLPGMATSLPSLPLHVEHACFLSSENMLVWSCSTASSAEDKDKSVPRRQAMEGLNACKLSLVRRVVEVDEKTLEGTLGGKINSEAKTTSEHLSEAGAPTPKGTLPSKSSISSRQTSKARILALVVGAPLTIDYRANIEYVGFTSQGLWYIVGENSVANARALQPHYTELIFWNGNIQRAISTPLIALPSNESKHGSASQAFSEAAQVLACAQDQLTGGSLLLLVVYTGATKDTAKSEGNLQKSASASTQTILRVLKCSVERNVGPGTPWSIKIDVVCSLKGANELTTSSIEAPMSKKDVISGDSGHSHPKVLMFAPHGHSILVFTHKFCFVFDRGTGIFLQKLALPGNGSPMCVGSWSINASFACSGIMTSAGVWTLVPPSLRTYCAMIGSRPETSDADQSTTSDFVSCISDTERLLRLAEIADLHGPSAKVLMNEALINNALDLDSRQLGNEASWRDASKSLQNPVIPLASHKYDAGDTFTRKALESYFAEHYQTASASALGSEQTALSKLTPLNISLMAQLKTTAKLSTTELVSSLFESVEFQNLNASTDSTRRGKSSTTKQQKGLANVSLQKFERLEKLSTREDLHPVVLFSDPKGRKKSAELLHEIESALGVNHTEIEDSNLWLDQLDGVLWPPSHPLLASELLASDAMGVTPVKASSASSHIGFTEVGEASLPSSSPSFNEVTYKNRLFELMCRLYYEHRPRALPQFVELVEKQLAASLGKVRHPDYGPVASRACQCLPLLPPIVPGIGAKLLDFANSLSLAENKSSREPSQNIEALRLEARAWLLLVSGEPIEAIRMLLLSCTWETSVHFCETVIARSDQLFGKKEGRLWHLPARIHTLLFEELLSYCLATHASPLMLEQVWPLLPDDYSIDQLLACIRPSKEQSILASGSAASFGAMKDIFKKIEERFHQASEQRLN